MSTEKAYHISHLIEQMNKIIQGKKGFYSYYVILSNFSPKGVIYITKLVKKFPGLIITFKIEPGNQPLVTEDYRLFLKKQILSSAQMLLLELYCIILLHQIKCLFGMKESNSHANS